MRIILALCFGLTHTAAALENREFGEEPSALLFHLNAWLDRKAEYERRTRAPSIKLVRQAQVEQLHGVADRSGGKTRGLFDAENNIIYLAEPWSADNPFDVSVLLHELVHHRQAGQHWYCPQAQEWHAYKIQAQWLREQSIQDGFFWPAIVLQSSCAKRDIHPG